MKIVASFLANFTGSSQCTILCINTLESHIDKPLVSTTFFNMLSTVLKFFNNFYAVTFTTPDTPGISSLTSLTSAKKSLI